MADYVAAYKLLHPTIEVYSERLKALLFDIARNKKIHVHAIEARAKAIDSFAEKIARPGRSYKDPLSDITDLCGLRVIVYYQEDVDAFCAAIRSELQVDDAHSVDKRAELKSDQFGYISVHLVCQLSKQRSSLVEWQPYATLNAEIQVRTVLQHAWASISHALQYKSAADVPGQFSRKLSRLAGLLELSDEQFSELRIESQTLRSVVSASLGKNDLNVDVDSIAIAEFLDSSSVARNIGDAARVAGLQVSGDNHHNYQILVVCQGLGLNKLDAVNNSLAAFLGSAPMFFQRFSKLRKL